MGFEAATRRPKPPLSSPMSLAKVKQFLISPQLFSDLHASCRGTRYAVYCQSGHDYYYYYYYYYYCYCYCCYYYYHYDSDDDDDDELLW